MKSYRMFLWVFTCTCALLISSSMAGAGEYVAKQGDTWAKVAKATGHTVKQLGLMNKIKEPKDSDPVPAGKKIITLSKEDIECAVKCCEKRHKEFSYGTGEYSKNFAALTNLKAKRFEYSPDDPYPYGIRFTEVLEYAKSWRGNK
jgi:hypothetical protein